MARWDDALARDAAEGERRRCSGDSGSDLERSYLGNLLAGIERQLAE